jgi:hypothetical protein
VTGKQQNSGRIFYDLPFCIDLDIHLFSIEVHSCTANPITLHKSSSFELDSKIMCRVFFFFFLILVCEAIGTAATPGLLC